MKLLVVAIFLVVFSVSESAARLQVRGKDLVYNGQKVFLSGANLAWDNYGNDWGSGKYFNHRSMYQGYFKEIADNGGNVVRIWVNFEGWNGTPKWDGNGNVVGTDEKNQLLSEMSAVLDDAAAHNIFVIFSLWNAESMKNDLSQNWIKLVQDDGKIQSYINNALKPLVQGLKNKKNLAAWEVINEPGAGVQPERGDANKCFDTNALKGSGSNWNGHGYSIRIFQRFINFLADAIHTFDPQALVTVGAFHERIVANQCDGGWYKCFNYYSDNCLMAAGGRPKGKLDFYEVHTYTWNGQYTPTSPAKNPFSTYNQDKPMIVGEFSTRHSEWPNDPTHNYKYLYENGYSGAIDWQYNNWDDGICDKRDNVDRGMSSIKGRTDHGLISVKLS